VTYNAETTHVRARMSAHASRQIYIHTCAGARTRKHTHAWTGAHARIVEKTSHIEEKTSPTKFKINTLNLSVIEKKTAALNLSEIYQAGKNIPIQKKRGFFF